MQDVVKMYEIGKSIRQIATEIGKTYCFVRKELINSGVIMRPNKFQNQGYDFDKVVKMYLDGEKNKNYK